MFKRLRSLLVGLLLFPVSTIATAEVIHWELSSHDVPDYMDESFTVSGGFDFNTDNNAISNITVKTTADNFCFTCNDYSGGMGDYFFDSANRPNIALTEVFKTGDVIDRSFSLIFVESLNLNGTPAFNWNTPDTFSNLGFRTAGFLRLDDPFDPDIVEDVDCIFCATAVGTLVPVPEPETYLMMLVGIVAVGWKVRAERSRARQA